MLKNFFYLLFYFWWSSFVWSAPLHKTKYFLDDFISFVRSLSNRVASHSDLITLRRAIRFLLIHVFFVYKLYIVIGVYVNGKKSDNYLIPPKKIRFKLSSRWVIASNSAVGSSTSASSQTNTTSTNSQ